MRLTWVEIICLLVIPGVLAWFVDGFSGIEFLRLGEAWRNRRAHGCVALWAAAIFVVMVTTARPPSPAEGESPAAAFLSTRGAWGWLGAILTVVVVPAVCEEFFFRGMVLRSLLSTKGRGAGLLLTTAAFVLMHLRFGVAEIILLSAVGLALGLLALATGGIWHSVLLHGINNLCALLVYHGIVPRPMIASGTMLMVLILALIWAVALNLALITPAAMRRGRPCTE